MILEKDGMYFMFLPNNIYMIGSLAVVPEAYKDLSFGYVEFYNNKVVHWDDYTGHVSYYTKNFIGRENNLLPAGPTELNEDSFNNFYMFFSTDKNKLLKAKMLAG